MAYLTDRKRAAGLGSAKSGTEHFWNMTVSSVALLILVPLFVFSFGPVIGMPYEEAVLYLARPFPAIIAGLTIVVAMLHFKNGIRVAIEDYSDGLTRHLLIIAATCLSYAVIATGLLALVRLAL
mgnify:CR=1 FL=1